MHNFPPHLTLSPFEKEFFIERYLSKMVQEFVEQEDLGTIGMSKSDYRDFMILKLRKEFSTSPTAIPVNEDLLREIRAAEEKSQAHWQAYIAHKNLHNQNGE